MIFTAVLIGFVAALGIVTLQLITCRIVISLCYIIINILSAFNVMNEAEQCPILKILLVLYVLLSDTFLK